ncbi:MAG TPA: hypothetical protein VMT03_07890 [Polyangia bacterium]|nr:hypothetical protein [Polyangia bacterium]
MTLGMVAPLAARADIDTGAPAPQTEQGAVGGPERPGGPMMVGPPHAPTGVGQSPVLLNSDDQHSIRRPVNTPPPGRAPSDTRGHYDLNEQGVAGNKKE